MALVVVACGGETPAGGQAFDPEASGGVGTSGDGETGTPGSTTSGGTSGDPTPTASSGTTAATSGETGDGSSDASTGAFDDCPRARVVVGVGLTLNVRPDPSTVNPPVASLANGALVDVLDEVVGETIDGSDLWYEIDTGSVQGFIFSGLAECTLEEAPELDPNGWYLPLPCGTTAPMTQGNNGALSHNGTSAFAFDFGLGLGSSLVAMADGVVTHTYDATGPGDPCYDGGGMECSGLANYVTLLHADGTKSVYMHLQSVSVAVGDTVPIGTEVGLSGSTGWSTGRHAHVMRMEDCGGSYCQSVPLAFSDVAGDGVPVSGEMVTSGNCP